MCFWDGSDCCGVTLWSWDVKAQFFIFFQPKATVDNDVVPTTARHIQNLASRCLGQRGPAFRTVSSCYHLDSRALNGNRLIIFTLAFGIQTAMFSGSAGLSDSSGITKQPEVHRDCSTVCVGINQ